MRSLVLILEKHPCHPNSSPQKFLHVIANYFYFFKLLTNLTFRSSSSFLTQRIWKTRQVVANKVLAATARKPNTEDLGLENTDIKIGSRSEIIVDDLLRAGVEYVWAIGDVKGGLQFTYISLDDYRIISDQLFGKSEHKVSDRKNVPYSVFLTPPLSNVGLTEREAQKNDVKYKLFKFMTADGP